MPLETTTEQLSSLTTLQVGGPASVVRISSEAMLATTVAALQKEERTWRVLGGGSNILAPDSGIADVVLKIEISEMNVVNEGETVLVTAGAGVVLDELVSQTVEEGWWGIENLSHIPGTVGAVPVQNVGAYGVEAVDVVHSVRVFNTHTMQYETLYGSDCQFGYRDSIFKHKEGAVLIITAVTFALSRTPTPRLAYKDLQQRFGGSVPSLQEIRSAIIAIRATKFPDWHTVGTAGSFFKNPIISAVAFRALEAKVGDVPGYELPDGQFKIPLGWVLDTILHLKGNGTKTVGLHEQQALVLVNRGGATAEDISLFATEVVAAVKDATDLVVEWEVTRW